MSAAPLRPVPQPPPLRPILSIEGRACLRRLAKEGPFIRFRTGWGAPAGGPIFLDRTCFALVRLGLAADLADEMQATDAGRAYAARMGDPT